MQSVKQRNGLYEYSFYDSTGEYHSFHPVRALTAKGALAKLHKKFGRNLNILGVVTPQTRRQNPNTATRTEVRSPTSTETSTEAYTADNVTVTGGAGAGANTKVTIINRRNGRAAGAVGNPPYIKGDDKHLLNELIDEVRGVKILWWSALSAQERKLVNTHTGVFKVGTVNGNKFVELKSIRNATAADFRQHQKIRLQELAALFQGEANGQKRRVQESDYTPNQKYRLGYLKLLKIKDSGKVIPITVNGDEKGVEAYLAADLRNNLLIVGKDARIEGVKLPPKGQLKYLGELSQIDYVTAKKHIGKGQLIHFYHKLGEVTRERPNLFIDDEGFPIIQGGNYDIWSVGIVN